MIKKYPDPSKQLPFYEKLLLNKEVSNIKWNDGNESGVLVKTTDGSVYVADYVIFTPSVGVLKHSHEELFSPALPEEKVTAIHDIGLGAIMDVSLYFPQRWWPSDNFTGYYFVWNEQDAEEFIKEKVSTQKIQFKIIFKHLKNKSLMEGEVEAELIIHSQKWNNIEYIAL